MQPEKPHTAETGRTFPASTDTQPTAIVIYCSDPRFQLAFEQFIEHDLGLPKGTYVPTVVGGGAGVLGHPEQLPKEFKFLKERLDTYRQIFPTAKRLILINHEDCRYYQTLKERVQALLGVRRGFMAHYALHDLSLVARAVESFLSHLGHDVEFYYAKFADPSHTRIQIERVSNPAAQ